jgi:hypothetical protein
MSRLLIRPLLLLPVFALLVSCPDTSMDLDRIESTERPGKLSEVLGVADELSNSIMLFGGNDAPIVAQTPGAAFRDDTWIFEPGFGWTEVSSAEHPSARGRYALAYDEAGRRALLFAGRWREANTTGLYDLYNDLWQFDFVTRSWSLLDAGEGDAPAGRYYPAGAWDAEAQTFYTWGGATNRSGVVIEPSSQLWAWTAGGGWSEVETTGNAPSTRAFFGSSYDPRKNRILVMAGQVGDFQTLAYNDFFALDLDDFRWRELHNGGSDGEAPSTRMHPGLIYDPLAESYLVFGGHTDIGDANDLWSFDPGDKLWQSVLPGDSFTGEPLGCLGNPAEVPAGYVDQDLSVLERRHRGMAVIMYDNIWVFGGMHAECSDQLDDTWRYSIADGVWHELIEARTGESCLRRNEDCECLCL